MYLIMYVFYSSGKELRLWTSKNDKKKHHKSQKSSFTNNLALRIRTYSNWHVAFRYETWNIVHKSMVVKGMENSG